MSFLTPSIEEEEEEEEKGKKGAHDLFTCCSL
jgi:hypothetical protein